MATVHMLGNLFLGSKFVSRCAISYSLRHCGGRACTVGIRKLGSVDWCTFDGFLEVSKNIADERGFSTHTYTLQSNSEYVILNFIPKGRAGMI